MIAEINTLKTYEAHQLANLVPPMSLIDFDLLKESIKSSGLINPIQLYEGKILDGRHRYKACNELGVQPKFQDYKGTDPVCYINAQNLARRHLTPSQLACCAALLHKELVKPKTSNGYAKGFTRGRPDIPIVEGYRGDTVIGYTCNQFNVGINSGRHAMYILKRDRDSFDKVWSGKSKLNATYIMVRKKFEHERDTKNNSERKSFIDIEAHKICEEFGFDDATLLKLKLKNCTDPNEVHSIMQECGYRLEARYAKNSYTKASIFDNVLYAAKIALGILSERKKI